MPQIQRIGYGKPCCRGKMQFCACMHRNIGNKASQKDMGMRNHAEEACLVANTVTGPMQGEGRECVRVLGKRSCVRLSVCPSVRSRSCNTAYHDARDQFSQNLLNSPPQVWKKTFFFQQFSVISLFRNSHWGLPSHLTTIITFYRVFRKNCVFSQFIATPPSPSSL